MNNNIQFVSFSLYHECFIQKFIDLVYYSLFWSYSIKF
eukprot:UN09460